MRLPQTTLDHMGRSCTHKTRQNSQEPPEAIREHFTLWPADGRGGQGKEGATVPAPPLHPAVLKSNSKMRLPQYCLFKVTLH